MKVASTAQRRPLLTGILMATVVVAILDISFATTWWVVIRHVTTVERVLQSIASGLLGADAFKGGARTALLGAVLHCIVAAGWSTIFFVAARRVTGVARLLAARGGAYKTGLPYGMGVWLLMNFVIVPLSHATPAAVNTTWFWASLAWHAVGVGLPIALIARADPLTDG